MVFRGGLRADGLHLPAVEVEERLVTLGVEVVRGALRAPAEDRHRGEMEADGRGRGNVAQDRPIPGLLGRWQALDPVPVLGPQGVDPHRRERVHRVHHVVADREGIGLPTGDPDGRGVLREPEANIGARGLAGQFASRDDEQPTDGALAAQPAVRAITNPNRTPRCV